jgi:hypothetical protein
VRITPPYSTSNQKPRLTPTNRADRVSELWRGTSQANSDNMLSRLSISVYP